MPASTFPYIDDNDLSIVTYSSGWTHTTGSGYYDGTATYSSTGGATASFNFTGTGLAVLGMLRTNGGQASISIDGGPPATFDTYANVTRNQAVLYQSGPLSSGAHTVEITVLGTHSAGSTGNSVFLDAFIVNPASSVFSVKDMGAVGDGAHDDTASIQAAFNAVTASGGGGVYFPSGQYRTTATISVADYGRGILVFGDGNASQVLADFSGDVFLVGAGQGILFQDLYVRCTMPGGGTSGAGINLTTGDSVRIENIRIDGTYVGLSCINGGGRTNLVGCVISGLSTGLYTQNPAHLLMTTLQGGQIAMCADSVNGSLWLMECELTGAACFVTRNTLALSYPNYGITLINVQAACVENSQPPPEGPGGFRMEYCYGELRLENCSAPGSGLTVGGNVNTQNVQITGGLYGGASYSGGLPNAIHIKSGTKILIDGCQIAGASSATADGILVDSAATSLAIQSCNFSGPASYCINSAATIGPCIIANNTFTAWGAAGGPVNYPAANMDQYVFAGNYPLPFDSAPSARVTLSSDRETTSTSLVQAAELGFPVTAGQAYEFEWTLYWQNDTSGDGAGFAVNGPATSLLVVDNTLWKATTDAFRNIDSAFNLARSRIAAAPNTTYAAVIKVIAKFNSSGTVVPRYKALNGGTVTLKAGSMGVCRIIPTPQEMLSIQSLGPNTAQLNWSRGTLQSAPNVNGPYVDIPEATPPYTITTTNAQQFYRIRL